MTMTIMIIDQVSGLQGLVSKSSVQASGFFKRHYENTLPGLASKMRTALNIDLEVSRTLNTLATMSSFICEILDIAG